MWQAKAGRGVIKDCTRDKWSWGYSEILKCFGVLHGLAGLDVVKVDFVLHRPEMKGLSGELGSIVHGDGGRQAAREGKFLKDLNDSGPADGGVDMDSQTLAGKVIDDVQAAEATAGRELVMNEVHAPTLVGTLGGSQGHSGHGWKLLAMLATQGEPFLAVDALGALVVDDKPLGFEDVVEDGSAPSWLEGRPVPQAMSQGDIVGGKVLILKAGTVPSRQPTDPACGEPKASDDFLHGRATRFGL